MTETELVVLLIGFSAGLLLAMLILTPRRRF